jgi:hypothetical protein
MLPWNFLVSITGFWNFKFRDVNVTMANASNELFFATDKPTDLQLTFPSYLVRMAKNCLIMSIVIMVDMIS